MSTLHHSQFLFKLAPLNSYVRGMLRTNGKIYGKSVFKLQAIKGRRYFSIYNEQNRLQLAEVGETHGGKSLNEIQNSQLLGRNVEGSNGNSNNGGNGNDNGNGGDHRGDEGQECNRYELTGIEWWWWWKWQQACYKTQNGDTQSHMWPVDTAVKVVANEVMVNIEPAVQAIVLGPIRQHINVQGFILMLVFGVFLVSCIQMVAGLAIASVGVSLAGLAAITLALVWRPWKRRSSQT